MHGEAPPPFDGEEAGLATKTTRMMICTYNMYVVYRYIGIMGHPGTVHGNPGHTSVIPYSTMYIHSNYILYSLVQPT